MNRFKQIASVALLGASLAISSCAVGLPAKVTRFSALPAPQGQSFFIVPGKGIAASGGLEFQSYASLVAQQLGARGYTPATSPQRATMLVQFGYDVDHGTVHREADPFGGSRFGGGYGGYGGFGYGGFGRYGRYGSGFIDPFYGVSYGRPYYSRFGYYGASSPFFYGWDDNSWYGDVREYTEYKSELTLDIRDRITNRPLFDGRAQARSTSDELGTLVPNLVEAMFTGFPGRNGETVKITVPARRSH